MPQLFAAAYLVRANRGLPPSPSSVVSAFYRARGTGAFPFDVGDDPAFFAASHLDGPVTWGVCRPDARGMIRCGDWVAFFSAAKSGEATAYRFVAALEVERKISHTGMWIGRVPLLSHYLNLLVRPSGNGWEQHEPGLHPDDWHADWLWRICDRTGLRKEAVVAAGKAHVPGSALRIGSRPLPTADNYVLFSRKSAIIVQTPLQVAEHQRGDPQEEWLPGTAPQRIRSIVFRDSPRGLRTANRQQPHRHFRREITSGDTWAREMRSVLAEAGLACR